MHRPLLAIACALALSGPALAQQDADPSAQPPRQGTPEPQGGSFLERVKNAFKSLGEKAKPAAETAAEKGREIKDDVGDKVKSARDGDTSAMGASGSRPAASSPQR